MKKFVFIITMFLVCFMIISCDQLTIESIEVVENMRVQYNIGDDFSNLRFTGGKIKVTHKNGNVSEEEVGNDLVRDIDLSTGIVKINYLNNEIDLETEGLNYISTSEELENSKNKSGIYILHEGTYEINTLRYDSEIALIGIGDVKVILSGVESSQAAALFQSNTTLVNIDFESTYNLGLINSMKIGNIEKDNDIPFINKFYASDVTIKGGKGINIMAVKKAELDNIDVIIDNTTKNVAMSISSGSDVVLKNSNISHGTWGSIAIFSVPATSTQEWYKRKSILTIINTDISQGVYIEYYSVNNSQINGLEAWKLTESNDYRIYTAQ